jgi:hypothetical protein
MSRIVEEVVELLGIEGIVQSVIGDEDTRGISGGQRYENRRKLLFCYLVLFNF